MSHLDRFVWLTRQLAARSPIIEPGDGNKASSSFWIVCLGSLPLELIVSMYHCKDELTRMPDIHSWRTFLISGNVSFFDECSLVPKWKIFVRLFDYYTLELKYVLPAKKPVSDNHKQVLQLEVWLAQTTCCSCSGHIPRFRDCFTGITILKVGKHAPDI